MKVLALVTEQAAIKKILEHLDLPLVAPPPISHHATPRRCTAICSKSSSVV
jgi:hypothetical protein